MADIPDEAVEVALVAFDLSAEWPSGLQPSWKAAAMRAALAAAQPLIEAAQWRPIASAPRDGTAILVWWPYWLTDGPFIVSWCDKHDRWEGEEVLSNSGDPPLCWRPLLPPPAENGDG